MPVRKSFGLGMDMHERPGSKSSMALLVVQQKERGHLAWARVIAVQTAYLTTACR